MIRIATLTTLTYDNCNKTQFDFMADQLKKEKIDILCCQEVFHSLEGRQNTTGNLANGLGMSYIFSAAHHKKHHPAQKSPGPASGLAILTGPDIWIHTTGTFPLPGTKHDEERTAQYAVVRNNGTEILVINILLSDLKSASGLRIQQLETVLAHPLMKEEFEAVFLCGNFNAKPNSKEIKFLTSRPEYTIRGSYPPIGKGSSWSALIKSTRNTRKKNSAYQDHIFSFTTSATSRIKLHNSRMLLEPDKGITSLSGHLCVIIDAELYRNKRPPKASYRHRTYKHFQTYNQPYSPFTLPRELLAII